MCGYTSHIVDAILYQRAFDGAGNPAAAIRRDLAVMLAGFADLDAVRRADILLVSTELVTNVCLHAAASGEIRVLLGEGVLTLEVADRDPSSLPESRPTSVLSPSGRGIDIVRHLSSSFTVEVAADRKRVRVELALTASV